MTRAHRKTRPLLDLLEWFVRLRWVAGAVVLVGAALEWRWLHWFEDPARPLGALVPGAMAGVGAIILSYNVVLWLVVRRPGGWARRRAALFAVSWAQLLLDMACLTLLVLLTGGAGSPLLSFFVLHMVFASLLLTRQMAYAGASLAVLMVAVGLWASGRLPAGRHDSIVLLGWVVTLLTTVWLANGITRSLRRQRRRLVFQNRRIRAMSLKLRHQQHGMIQQEKMAAAGRMAAGVAHEIANPLASMDGLLQLMERRPEKLRPDAIAILREQVGRISGIVRRMTEFAHPGDGQWQELSLNDVLDRTLEMLRFDSRIKRVQIERQFAADLPPVRVLPDAIQQVVVNLVINALDAMEAVAQPKLTVRTHHSADWCSFEIQDNGHGISANHRRKIFEPFFTTKPVGKGTGLGLSISYSLVRRLGGNIKVESRPGAGARFTIRLPAVAAVEARK